MRTLIVNQYLNKSLFEFPGAVAAYSLRQLSSTTTPVIKVRRSNDNAEQDFTALSINDGTLTTWVGAGNDGFIRTWYDQSSNGNHAEQPTTTNQPEIVVSGSLVTENGLAAIRFINTNEYFINVGSIGTSSYKSIFAVTSLTSENHKPQIGFMDGTEDYVPVLSVSTTGVTYRHSNTTPYTVSLSSSSNTGIWSALLSSNLLKGGINGSYGQVTIPGYFFSHLRLGARGFGGWSNYFGGTMQEIIIYPSDQTTNRGYIETNINNYYNIF